MADQNDAFKQLSQSADYYPPSLYMSALRQHASMEFAQDPIAEDFVPLTSVRLPSEAVMRLMVVGVIPPVATVSGRMLDRSRSVASLTSGFEGPALDLHSGDGATTSSGGISTAGGPINVAVVAGEIGENGGPPIITTYSPRQVAAIYNEAWYKINGSYPSKETLALMVGQSFMETNNSKGGFDWPNNNPAFYGNNYPHPKTFYWAGTKTTFWSFDTPQQGAAAVINNQRPATRAAYATGDPDAVALALQNQGYYTLTSTNGVKNTPEQQRALYAAGIRAGYNQAIKLIGDPSTLGKVQVAAAPTPLANPNKPVTNFQQVGSGAANDAAKEAEHRSASGLNADTGLGLQFTQAQQQMQAQIQAGIQDMANTPPLRFLVNPSSLSINHEKVISDGDRSRRGPIVEQWGDGQDTLEVSGKVGAFYALDVGRSAFADGGPGITRNARTVSAAYQNFMSLYQIYRNNAGIFLSDSADITSPRMNLALMGSIYIYYDYTLYIGSFDTFSVTEADSSPYTIEYSFQFTVRATFALDRVPDQRP